MQKFAVTVTNSAGLTGDGGLKAEAGRYNLYVSLACPWAHRAFIFRKPKGLEDMISLSAVNRYMGAHGWTFYEGRGGVIPESVNGAEFLCEVYAAAKQSIKADLNDGVTYYWCRYGLSKNQSFCNGFNETTSISPRSFTVSAPYVSRDKSNKINS